MQYKNILTILICFVAAFSFAQKPKLPLEGTVQAGLLEGEQGSALHFGVTGGVKFKTWTTSVGIGLDYYGVRSIPLYLNVQKNIFNRTQTPFVYAGSGYHFPWVPTHTKDTWGEAKTDGGLYFQAGVGYQLPVLKNAALFFTTGYSFKRFSERFRYTYPCLIGPCPEYNETVDYGLRRLSITTGLRF